MATKEQKEKVFLEKIGILQQIENELNDVTKNYSEGQLGIGLAGFQNDSLSHQLKPKSFGVGCASLVVQVDKASKKLNLVEPPKKDLKFLFSDFTGREGYAPAASTVSSKSKNPIFDYEEDYEKASLKEEQLQVELEAQENGSNPLNQLGIQFPSQTLLNAQTSMRKTLEAAINIANLLEQLKAK